MTGIGRERQAEIFLRGLAGRPPRVPTAPDRLEEKARRALSDEAFAYLAGGAGVEGTMAANRAAFDRWRIVPRVLRDVSRRDLSIELFGERLSSPFLLAPIGVLELAHREADLAVARAASAEGVPFVISSQASVPMEACAAAMGEAPRWFQLYWSEADEVAASFLSRAEAAGCRAIVLTLDTTLLGWRPRDLDLGALPFLRGRGIAQYTSDPAFLAALERDARSADSAEGAPRPPVTLASLRAAVEQARRHPGSWWRNLRTGTARRAVRRFIATYSRPSLTWEDLPRLREMTRLPVLLKGILHPEDARRARAAGMAGIIVSNHGGRQVDGALGALDALPGVVAAVEGEIAVLFDSGVRGGADAFKALALGADAVCIGRPYAYGLAIDGAEGVRAVIRNFVAELDLTVALSGLTRIRDVGPEALVAAEWSRRLPRRRPDPPTARNVR